MKKLLITCAAAALSAGLLSPVYAQDSSQPTAPATQAPGAQTAPQTAPSSPQADLTGQTIYTSKGTKIGTVASMSSDAQGQQNAVVGVEKFLGMGGKNVLFPVSSLSPKDGGGYSTSLTSAEIKKLPEAKSDAN